MERYTFACMELTDNDDLLSALKQAVLQIFGHTLDSTSDFDSLSYDILQKTGENISASTLKRIYGYVKYDTFPRVSTLSILSRYAGYSGWSDFCSKNIGDNMPEPHLELSRKRTPKIWIIAGIVSSIVIVVTIGIYLSGTDRSESRDNSTPIENITILKADDPIESKYNSILAHCFKLTQQKCDSVKQYKNRLSDFEYIEFCENAYTDIVFRQMKNEVRKCLEEAFPKNEDSVALYSNMIFAICRDEALNLITQFSTEERRKAHAEEYQKKYGTPLDL